MHRKNDVQGWGLSGATWSSDQRMSVLSKRLSASGYWEITYNKPPQTQVTQRAPRHWSSRARKHRTHQHSTEPETTPTAWDPKATSLNPAPEVHSERVPVPGREDTAHTRAGSQRRVALPEKEPMNRAHWWWMSGSGYKHCRDFPGRESASPGSHLHYQLTMFQLGGYIHFAAVTVQVLTADGAGAHARAPSRGGSGRPGLTHRQPRVPLPPPCSLAHAHRHSASSNLAPVESYQLRDT